MSKPPTNENELSDEISAITRRWIDAFNISRPSEVPGTIYHYTTAAGLKGMLESGKVRSTDYRFLNDATEVRYGLELGANFVENLRGSANAKKHKQLVDAIFTLGRIPSDSNYFIFSMSENRDDLSQWRGYASDGEGFTVGLSGEELRKMSASEDAEFGFAKVSYDVAKYDNTLRDCFTEVAPVFEKLEARRSLSVEEIFKAASEFDSVIEVLSLYSKHKSFRSENEWRLCTDFDEEAINERGRTRIKGNQLIPYIELPLSEDGRLPLLSVGIGPGHSNRNVDVAVTRLCNEFGYKPEVYTADTPFRRG